MISFDSFALVLIIGSFFFYLWYWEPKVVNKNKDYFKVMKIEREVITEGRGFFLLFDFACFLDLYRLYCKMFMDNPKHVVKRTILYIIWNVVMLFIFSRQYKCLPMKKKLDVREMIRSIESERFYQVSDVFWYSQNWIRISYRFFPKNVILGIEKAHGFDYLAIYAIDGKEYKVYGVLPDRLKEKDREEIRRLEESLPIGEAIKREGEHIRRKLHKIKDSRKLYYAYMESHTTMEFITNTELIDILIKQVCDSERENEGNRRRGHR